MILRQLGSNQTELSLNNGTSLFFSYETPVAGFSPDLGWFKTSTYYSRTTSKHINQYFRHAPKDKIRIVSDDVISEMCHPDDRIKVQNVDMRNIQLTESEETVLVQMAVFFSDLGTPDEFDQDSFNSLFEKITEPSPFDYV